MKMMTMMAVVVGLAVPSVARADEKLDRLVGTWKATGAITMGKDSAKTTATWTCKHTASKAGVACDLELKGVPGLAVYAEHDLFGFEPNTGTYHWFSVTNAGETHDHVAKAMDGKTQFVFTGTQEGKPFKEVIDLDMAKDGKSFTLRAETFVANASTSVFDFAAKRAK